MDERQEKKYARDEREDGGDKPDGHAKTGQSNEDQVDRQEDSFGLRHEGACHGRPVASNKY
jgi:hypothetical protein